MLTKSYTRDMHQCVPVAYRSPSGDLDLRFLFLSRDLDRDRLLLSADLDRSLLPLSRERSLRRGFSGGEGDRFRFSFSFSYSSALLAG